MNFNTDGNNCGGCGKACTGGLVCNAGTCSADCTGGTTKCGINCVNTQSDAANCGTCGTSCSGGRTCSAGNCACSGGQQFCNNQCTDVSTNFANCGACGKTCSTGQQCVSGSCTGGSGTGGAGGASGGSSNGGSSNGGSSNGGSSNGGGSSGGSSSGGSSSGGSSSGGAASGGATTSGGNSSCPAVSTDLVADFEENSGVMKKQANRTGFFYTYAENAAGLNPPKSTTAIPVAASGDTNMCNKYALHVTGTSIGTYGGFGAGFIPMGGGSDFKSPYDVSAYTGISFKIKSGSSTVAPIFFELLSQENQPAAAGGTATSTAVDQYNTRGVILQPPYIGSAINNSAYQTVYVPFAGLFPRWMPAPGSGGQACPAPGSGVPKCQAPKFVAKNALGIQFSLYSDPGFPTSGGSFDMWVDDITLVKGDTGIQTRTGFPLSGAGSVGSGCTKPTGADSKYLIPAYNLWKTNFVRDDGSFKKVIRPENGNDTVSEGIAYGMLIAVNMNDQQLFDGLYGYWKSKKAAGSSAAGLMNWCIPAGSGSCPASGGSATDADEDAAFALLQAGKVWGGSYAADGKALVQDIYASADIDKTTKLPAGGSQFGNKYNPSYFAPAYYRAFAAIDSGNDWNGVVTAVYDAIANISGTYGLVPAWCAASGGKQCMVADSNGGANDQLYQYDSHRTPMRIGMDYCWNNEAKARTYVDKTTTFFATNANAGLNGVDRIFDIYQLNGGTGPGGPNSASVVGTAAVGAMASSVSSKQPFLDDAYQAVLDTINRANIAPKDTQGRTPYSYYNATVGLLTALIMTGNFSH
ncbi:MAG: glycosyl hydrolase family 8 [Polyangiaceae bacterium]